MKIAKNMEYIFIFATVVGLSIVGLNQTEYTDIQVSAPAVVMVEPTQQG